MNEKIKKFFKNKYFKIIIVVLLWLFILRELYAVYVDMYNFRQLEKAKPYLETINENTKNFWLNCKKCVAKIRNIWYNKAKYSFIFNYVK